MSEVQPGFSTAHYTKHDTYGMSEVQSSSSTANDTTHNAYDT